MPEVVQLEKHNMVLVWCDCYNPIFTCPQGHASDERCKIWMMRDHLTPLALEHHKSRKLNSGET
jgi:hypothetical protein